MAAHQIHIYDLKINPIDTRSPIPLYYQVEADLRTLLNSEMVAPGDLLPTEHDLAEAYGVGRHTIRTALSRLVNDHLIVRKAGHGTIVQGREDFAGVDMLYRNPGVRRLAFALLETFIYPWGSSFLGWTIVVLAVAHLHRRPRYWLDRV